MAWTHKETAKIIAMVKEHGRDFKRIAYEFEGEKSMSHCMAKLGAIKLKMQRRPDFYDEEYMTKITARFHGGSEGSMTSRMIELVKLHGKDYDSITAAFGGFKTRQ